MAGKPTWIRWPLGALCAMLSPGCTIKDGPCDIPTCEYGVNTIHLQSGTIDWTPSGRPGRSANVSSAAQPAGDCELAVIPGKISSPADLPAWQDGGVTTL